MEFYQVEFEPNKGSLREWSDGRFTGETCFLFLRGQFSACLKRTDHFIWFLCIDNEEKLFIGALEDLDCFGCS